MIDDNFVFNNLVAGIAADVGGDGLSEFDVRVANNQVKDNGGNGLALTVAGDAVADVEIVDNAFVGNAIDGIIILDGQSGGDTGRIIGEISRNTLANNGIHGLDIQTRSGDDSLAVSEGVHPGRPARSRRTRTNCSSGGT